MNHMMVGYVWVGFLSEMTKCQFCRGGELMGITCDSICKP